MYINVKNKFSSNIIQNIKVSIQFLVPQIEYTLGGSSKKGSHVYFLLIVAMVQLLWPSDCTIVTTGQHLYQTIVQFDKTIVLPRKFATGSIHDYLFDTAPLVAILFYLRYWELRTQITGLQSGKNSLCNKWIRHYSIIKERLTWVSQCDVDYFWADHRSMYSEMLICIHLIIMHQWQA